MRVKRSYFVLKRFLVAAEETMATLDCIYPVNVAGEGKIIFGTVMQLELDWLALFNFIS